MTQQLTSLVLSAGLIAVILWWFFGRTASEGSSESTGSIQKATVIIDGGYKPEITNLVANKPAQITFVRKDKSSCLEEVIVPDYGIQKKLKVGESYTFSLPEMNAGEYGYSCGMRMYHGKLKVN